MGPIPFGSKLRLTVELFFGFILLPFALLFGVLLFPFKPLFERYDRKRGWRIRPIGRDGARYEEFSLGQWHGFAFTNELLCGPGKGRCVYFPSASHWSALPTWAQGRRDQILHRVQSKLKTSNHDYQDA